MASEKDIKWRLKEIWIFARYILSEPFRQLAKPRAWLYIYLIIFFITLLREDKLLQIISFFIIVSLILWMEWESGKFREQWRKDYGKIYKSDLQDKLKK